jgi:YcaO-like protein with predicted kinase domain
VRKVHTSGTHRVSSLDETRARIWPLLRPLGITRVADITGRDCIGLPVVAVYRPNARSLSVAQGKGLTLAAAEISGVMESLEFFHAENISTPVLLGSYNQLRFTYPLLEPATLPKSAVGRYHPELKLPWARGIDLMGERECYVPLELVHMDLTLPLPPGAGCFPVTSNGLASGNHLWEAVSHAISELVERDAATLFSLLSAEERTQRELSLDSVDDSDCEALLQQFRRAGISVKVFDMTSDVDIAVFRAVIFDAELRAERPLAPSTGTGCHPARGIALARALTEAAQSRLTIIAGSRDDLPSERYGQARDMERLRRQRAELVEGAPTRAFSAAPDHRSHDVGEDVAWQKQRLREAGLEQVAVVDLSKAELGIPVVRVVIPGLEPSRDVPGWRPGPRARRLLARGEA